jgi:hypothetical protein
VRRAPRTSAAIVAAALVGWSSAAAAQTAEENSVARRARPDFDPIGIELDEMLGVIGLVGEKEIAQKSSALSSFVVFPSFGITADYVSNLFLASSGEVTDKRFTYSPGLSIQSDWGRHSFALVGNASLGRHQKTQKEDFEDWQAQASGTIEVHDDKKVSMAAGFARRHSPRSAEDDPGQAFEPIVSENLFFDGSAEYNADAVLLRFRAQVEDQDYLNSPGLNNDARDVTVVNLVFRAGYEFAPGTTFFVEPHTDFRMFALKTDSSGLKQDNQGMGVLAGITWDLTGVTFAELGVGFSRRSYDEPSFSSPTNLDFSGRLVWNITDLLTLSGKLNRTTQESTTAGESGVLTTSLTNRLDYEFLDNIIVTAGSAITLSDNQQGSRSDRDYAFDGGVTYLANENWVAKLSVVRSMRRSNIEGRDYDNLTAGFTLTARM